MLLINNLAGVLPCRRRSLNSANTLEGTISKHRAEESQEADVPANTGQKGERRPMFLVSI